MFLQFWHISPRQQTAAQKPFSRQALVQSGVMTLQHFKNYASCWRPQKETNLFSYGAFVLQYILAYAQQFLTEFSTRQKTEITHVTTCYREKVFVAICSVVYSQDEIIINQTWGMIFEINVHKRSCLN